MGRFTSEWKTASWAASLKCNTPDRLGQFILGPSCLMTLRAPARDCIWRHPAAEAGHDLWSASGAHCEGLWVRGFVGAGVVQSCAVDPDSAAWYRVVADGSRRGITVMECCSDPGFACSARRYSAWIHTTRVPGVVWGQPGFRPNEAILGSPLRLHATPAGQRRNRYGIHLEPQSIAFCQVGG